MRMIVGRCLADQEGVPALSHSSADAKAHARPGVPPRSGLVIGLPLFA
jgi:hypothetical protein